MLIYQAGMYISPHLTMAQICQVGAQPGADGARAVTLGGVAGDLSAW